MHLNKLINQGSLSQYWIWRYGNFISIQDEFETPARRHFMPKKIKIVSLSAGVSRDERAVRVVATFAALRHNSSGKLGARQLEWKMKWRLFVSYSPSRYTSKVRTGAESGATCDESFSFWSQIPTLTYSLWRELKRRARTSRHTRRIKSKGDF